MPLNFEVNKALVPVKAQYFLWNAGTAPTVPYLSLYARQLGFSSVIVGLIYTILPIFGMIVKPVFGAIADRFHCQKKIFLIAQLLTAASFLAIFYAPKVPNDTLVNLSCNDSGAIFHNENKINVDIRLLEKIQSKNVLTTCKLSCQTSARDFPMLCESWKLVKYCDNLTVLSNITEAEFLISVPMAKTLFSNETIIGKNGNVSFNEIVKFMIANVTIGDRVFNPQCLSDEIRSVCNLECSDNDIDDLFLKSEVEMKDSDVYRTYQFWVFLLLMMTSWMAQAVSVSLSDAICFEMLGDQPHKYGYQRMYGALGWGLVSLLSGVIIDQSSKDKSYTDYSVCFYLAAGLLILDFCVSCTLKYTQTRTSTNILKDVGKVLSNIKVIVFMLWCTCVGMCTGLMWNFFPWLIEDLAKAQGETETKTLQGVIMAVQCLGGELPFFFLSGKILKKIGHVTAMSAILFTFGTRFILHSVIKNPWWFIPIGLSSGLTTGLCYAVMATYASIVAPPGTEATMQGMVGSVFEGVGVSLGSFLGGLALSSVSSSMAFQYFGIAALSVCLLHIIVQYLIQMKSNSAQRALVGHTESRDSLVHIDQ